MFFFITGAGSSKNFGGGRRPGHCSRKTGGLEQFFLRWISTKKSNRPYLPCDLEDSGARNRSPISREIDEIDHPDRSVHRSPNITA